MSANGYVLWRGPSRLDGSPVVVIATGLKRKSTNTKTGEMVQTYILRTDMHPVEAVHSGADEAICGSCPLRPMLAKAAAVVSGVKEPECYVNKGHGPGSVYRGWLRGIYPTLSPRKARKFAERAGLAIRFGAYGDPGAVPTAIWDALDGKRHTGYTHQWRIRPSLRRLTMASADSLADAREAWARGWRTFRVIRDVSELQPNEILCPASAEGGRKTQCDRCGLCNGSNGATDRRKNIAIVDHGPTAARMPRKPLTIGG